MKTYRITYTDFAQKTDAGVPGRQVVVTEAQEGTTALHAIESVLRDRLGDDFEIGDFRTMGYRNRAVVAGITFHATLNH